MRHHHRPFRHFGRRRPFFRPFWGPRLGPRPLGCLLPFFVLGLMLLLFILR